VKTLELFEIMKTSTDHLAPNGQPWPLSLTFADGTYLPAVRCTRLTHSAPPAGPIRVRLIGHDLGRNVSIDVDVEELTDARLTEETWEEMVLPEPTEPGEDPLTWSSHERLRAKAVLTENAAIPPVEADVLPFSFVVLDFTSPHGGEPSRHEDTVATSLIDKRVRVGSPVWVEYEERGPGRTKVVRINPRDA
jgi:hypothetical protein